MRRPGMQQLGALPIFWQTLILVLAAVVIAQLIGLLLILVNPPPRPQFNRLTDVAAFLLGEPREQSERDRPLTLHLQPRPPAPRAGMIGEPAIGHALAERAGLDDARVRLFFEPERSLFGRRHRPEGPVSIRHGEPLFFTPMIAAVATPHGWRVAETPPSPLVAPWQRQMMLWLVASAIALTPLAWTFARALARPIRRFAEAAERLGGDPQAPPVAQEGPAELRTTARALNGMQARIAGYVGERTEMIGAIAHDLRTPLARIAFRIEGAPEPLREKVLADVEQMRAMLAATIGFVRATGSPSPRVAVDLAALLAAVVEQDRDLGRAVTLAAARPAKVSGDPMMLERLFQNLIDNALAYAGAVEVTLAAEAGSAVARLRDSGPGLPPELLTRAFQPFVRGDPSRNRATGGIGLGLTIARTIAEDHGGTIALANRDGGGLEATVRLPLIVAAY